MQIRCGPRQPAPIHKGRNHRLHLSLIRFRTRVHRGRHRRRIRQRRRSWMKDYGISASRIRARATLHCITKNKKFTDKSGTRAEGVWVYTCYGARGKRCEIILRKHSRSSFARIIVLNDIFWQENKDVVQRTS